jgi:hypothetical protein
MNCQTRRTTACSRRAVFRCHVKAPFEALLETLLLADLVFDWMHCYGCGERIVQGIAQLTEPAIRHRLQVTFPW